MNVKELIGISDVPLELGVLSYIISSNAIPVDVRKEYFTGERSALFEEIKKQFDKSSCIDVSCLNEKNKETVSTALEYGIVNEFNFTSISESKLKNLWICREYAKSVFTEAYSVETIVKSVQDITRHINNTIASGNNNDYDHDETLSRLAEQVYKGCSGSSNVSGYPIGIPAFDKLINGFQKGNLYVIGALKKTGKSRFMIYSAIKMAEQGLRVVFNSLEMSGIQINSCALSYYSGVDGSKFGHNMSEDLRRSVGSSFSNVAKLNWNVVRIFNVDKLRSYLWYLKSRNEIDVLFVDFVQNMQHAKARDRVREVEYSIKALADMSREFNICIIAISQLSGAAERCEGIPDMSYCKDSQAIPENADCIIILHRNNRHEDPWDEAFNYIVPEFHAKVEQRYGLSGAVVKFFGDLRTCRYGAL